MAVITLAVAEARLQAYLDAEEAVLVRGQSYTMEMDGSRRVLARADLPQIQAGIKLWGNRVAQLNRAASGRSNTRTIVN